MDLLHYVIKPTDLPRRKKRRGVDYITPQLPLIRSLSTSNIFDYNRTPVSMIICFFFFPNKLWINFYELINTFEDEINFDMVFSIYSKFFCEECTERYW